MVETTCGLRRSGFNRSRLSEVPISLWIRLCHHSYMHTYKHTPLPPRCRKLQLRWRQRRPLSQL